MARDRYVNQPNSSGCFRSTAALIALFRNALFPIPLFYYQLLVWNGLGLFSIFCWLDLYISYIDFRLSLRIVHFRSSDLCHNNTSFHEVTQLSMTSFLDVFVWSINVQQDT